MANTNTPPTGIAMVTRDHCDARRTTLEQRLHDRIASVRNDVTELRVAAATAGGERKGLAKDIDELVTLKQKINGLVWKVAIAAVGGGGGMPVILSKLGVI